MTELELKLLKLSEGKSVEFASTFASLIPQIIEVCGENQITVSGHDLELISNFMAYSDPENLDHEVTIAKYNTGFAGAGIYAWCDEYPDEGSIKLCEQKQWQPDWSQAPDWANWWCIAGESNFDVGLWFDEKPVKSVGNSWTIGAGKEVEDSPTFNYQGDWCDSLRKRPEVE